MSGRDEDAAMLLGNGAARFGRSRHGIPRGADARQRRRLEGGQPSSGSCSRGSRSRLLLLLAGLAAVPSPVAAQDAGPVLDLRQAIEIALANNYAIQRSRNALAAAQSGLIVSQNRFDFQLSTSLGDTRQLTRNLRVLDPGGTELHRDVFDDAQALSLGLGKEDRAGGRLEIGASLFRTRQHFASPSLAHFADYSLTYTLPLWGGRGREVATRGLVGARQAYLDQTRSLTESEHGLAVDVTGAYHEVLRREALIAISRKAAARAEERLDQARLRLAEGLITPIDVKRAERDARDRENEVIAAVEAHEAALDAFALQLGLPLGSVRELAPLVEHFEALEISLDEAVREAQAQRFDLRSEREALGLAELDVRVARSNARPRLDLSLGASFRTEVGNEPKEYFDLRNDDAWSGALAFVHVFNDRSDDEALVRSLIALDDRRIALVESEQRVALQVRAAVRRIRSLERRIEILAETKELTEEALALAELQFEEDLISTTDLLQDQDEVVSAERQYVDALADHAIARASLELTLGRYEALGRGRRSEFLRSRPEPPELDSIGSISGIGAGGAGGASGAGLAAVGGSP